jgi:hypothetical protein
MKRRKIRGLRYRYSTKRGVPQRKQFGVALTSDGGVQIVCNHPVSRSDYKHGILLPGAHTYRKGGKVWTSISLSQTAAHLLKRMLNDLLP